MMLALFTLAIAAKPALRPQRRGLKIAAFQAGAAKGRLLDEEDDEAFAACVGDEGPPVTAELARKNGECAAQYPNSERGEQIPVMCALHYAAGYLPEEVTKENMELLCETYCSKITGKPEWCPSPSNDKSGLSGGAIAGIVVAAVVVVVAIVGLCVYCFVIKPKQAASVASAPS
jgi:hypothetical protein